MTVVVLLVQVLMKVNCKVCEVNDPLDYCVVDDDLTTMTCWVLLYIIPCSVVGTGQTVDLMTVRDEKSDDHDG